MIRLLSQLHQADVLQCDVPPDTGELFRRYQQRQRRALMSKAFSLLGWKFPLFDPERFLNRFLPLVRLARLANPAIHIHPRYGPVLAARSCGHAYTAAGIGIQPTPRRQI